MGIACGVNEDRFHDPQLPPIIPICPYFDPHMPQSPQYRSSFAPIDRQLPYVTKNTFVSFSDALLLNFSCQFKSKARV